MNIRIGQGVDVHRFCSGNQVTLGGVVIPFDQGLDAHSDGDVALHALCDALLGAAALGDIGKHFPPNDSQWENADSRLLLRQVADVLKSQGWSVANVDLTIICEAPRIAPYITDMVKHIASDLDVSEQQVSVKATTTEKLGFCGRGEGIAATAVALIQAS